MTTFRGKSSAFGGPGKSGTWAPGAKSGVGTAYSASSRIWFTIWRGILTEIYYPRADRPQVKDLQFLITDGTSFFHEEKSDLKTNIETIGTSLGYKIENTDPGGRYTITKEIISDPHLACVLQHVKIDADQDLKKVLKLYAYCTPHLRGGGSDNSGYVVDIAGQTILAAEREGTWLAMGCTVPFSRMSCGFVGESDGLTDLATDKTMDWEFDQALNGNIGLTGQIDVSETDEFVLGVALGYNLHNACTTLLQSLAPTFDSQRSRFVDQWARTADHQTQLKDVSSDDGHLYQMSCEQLLAHEDKLFPGAVIASLAFPWGESKGDEDTGGYHLVWVRDLVQSVSGLLAAGHLQTPLRALIYLAANQDDDGGFPQNFFIDGQPYWRGIQLDEVAYPLILARLLYEDRGGIPGFRAFPMLVRAAGYLIRHGPVTEQERWEESSGYSPSTLAVCIAGLITVARACRMHDEVDTAAFIEDYADWLESHLDLWTVTHVGTLLPGVERHYVRIAPANIGDTQLTTGPDGLLLGLANLEPGTTNLFPASEIVDAGFLELVRFGIRKADDPLIVDSVKVIDSVLKVDTPFGPVWRRYNNDGYGQRADGSAYKTWGKGRAWPLLTGERGHYELAAGRDASPYLAALEAMASATGLLPEQVWDTDDLPDQGLSLGSPTGSAMPLMWAHAEYIRLLRSVKDGKVFALLPEVAERYAHRTSQSKVLEIWSPRYPVSVVPAGTCLRVQAGKPFRLHWSLDEWNQSTDTVSAATIVGVSYVDIAVPVHQSSDIRFTFFWTSDGKWEEKDYAITIADAQPAKG